MWNFGYHLARVRGSVAREAYRMLLPMIVRRPIDPPRMLDIDVFAYLYQAMLPDQVVSIRSYFQSLGDCQVAGDERLLRDPAETVDPVNTGVLFFFQKLDWSLAMERFEQLHGLPNFFTNQTLTHLTMHANGARALDPVKFVLQLD